MSHEKAAEPAVVEMPASQATEQNDGGLARESAVERKLDAAPSIEQRDGNTVPANVSPAPVPKTSTDSVNAQTNPRAKIPWEPIGTVATIVFGVVAVFAWLKPVAPQPAPTSTPEQAPAKPSAEVPRVEPPRPNPEESLKWLSTGISRASLEQRFGVPRFETADPILHAKNLVFVFPRFFLQAFVGLDGRVLLYSVTTRSADFRPAIPKLGGQLLSSTYASFGGAGPFNTNTSSKYFEYREQVEPVNATNFKTIYLGYCPAGVFMPEQTTIEESEARANPATLKRYRANNAPNCYGVGDTPSDDEQLIQMNGFGLNYFLGRDLYD